MQPLIPIRFGEDSGIDGAIAYITDEVNLTQLHIKLIVEARQMTIEWACTEDKDYVKGWDPSKHF
jgi:hypothetical protein